MRSLRCNKPVDDFLKSFKTSLKLRLCVYIHQSPSRQNAADLRPVISSPCSPTHNDPHSSGDALLWTDARVGGEFQVNQGENCDSRRKHQPWFRKKTQQLFSETCFITTRKTVKISISVFPQGEHDALIMGDCVWGERIHRWINYLMKEAHMHLWVKGKISK